MVKKQIKKNIKVQNKSDKPDNIILKEQEIKLKCNELEKRLPNFLRSFFIYLKGNVLPMTRLAYLGDIAFFFEYLVTETALTDATEVKDIKIQEIDNIKAVDVNIFIDYCRNYEVETSNSIYVYENSNKTLARKRSSLSVMFKQLFRDELIKNNITEGFDIIRVPKAGEREIKALEDNEVMVMLDCVEKGTGLTKKEYEFWEKTKKRDKAILLVFLTYGLRLSELQQLNVSSFNFTRGNFKIYRKRGKESLMPLNKSIEGVIKDYIDNERSKIPVELEEHNDALFLSLQGKRMGERQIRELVKKYTALGLKTSKSNGYSPHKLRATTATSLIGRGNSIYDVQALLDHEQITTTQLYAAHKKNVKRDLVNSLEWDEERKEGEGDFTDE